VERRGVFNAGTLHALPLIACHNVRNAPGVRELCLCEPLVWGGGIRISDLKNLLPLGSHGSQTHRLDHDDFRELLTDGQASIANLADEVSLAGEKLDDMVFAESQFTQSALDFWAGAQLLDPYRYSCLNPAQRADFAPILIPALCHCCVDPVHNLRL
jgi:hypothetical protein